MIINKERCNRCLFQVFFFLKSLFQVFYIQNSKDEAVVVDGSLFLNTAGWTYLDILLCTKQMAVPTLPASCLFPHLYFIYIWAVSAVPLGTHQYNLIQFLSDASWCRFECVPLFFDLSPFPAGQN